ncbi:MAG: hypothetical protein HDT28_04310 [Clostridiales bacterium]|nr:hypothetical protein [Clostridiales bacterium]
MLKNRDIISKLTDDQKIAFATDINATASDALTSLGVPRIESTTLENVCALFGGDAVYPALSSLASSWNPKLITQVVSDIMQRSGAEKYNLVFAPDVSFKSSAYSSGLSEDPFLSAKIGGAAVTAIEDTGAAACVIGGSVRQIDADYSDLKPDPRAINELYGKAFDMVMRNREPSAVRLSYGKLKGSYKEVNDNIVNRNLEKNVTKTVIVDGAYEEALRSGIGKDKLLFIGSSPAAVRSALKNYKRMKEDVERGSISLEELKTAIERGTAISTETLDTAVDNVIEFGKKLQRARKHYAAGNGQSDYSKRQVYGAALESIVLLKNADNVLPVRNVRIGAVGEILSAYPDHVKSIKSSVEASGSTFVGYADGYRLDQDRSDELLQGAASLAKDCDIVVAFLGLGARREQKLQDTRSVKLPANQLVLLDTLLRSGKKVIAVVCGAIVDMKFDNNVHASLSVPLGGSGTLNALFDIIFGASPSGKLACSAYDDTDEAMAYLRNCVRNNKFKMGEFVGYRRYTTENRRIKYPFGYGLSYAKFEYSNLVITPENIEVTVKNVGSVPAYEVAQLYVGKTDSAVPRPVKELKGFAKTLIQPNSSVHITFPINAAMLDTFDEATGTRKTEGGRYEIYVGASCTDIRLRGAVEVSGATFTKRGNMSDYLEGFDEAPDFSAVDKKGFNSARPAESFSFEKLFADEFEDDSPDIADDEFEDDGQDDYSMYIDDGVTAKTLVGWLISAGKSKGVGIDQKTAREIVGAFSASRAVLFKCSQSEFAMLSEALSAFCGCALSKDDSASYVNSDNLFINGNDTALTSAIGFAETHRDVMTLVSLDNVSTDILGEVFVPFIRYATAPDSMTVTFGRNKRALNVSPNLWFIMRLDERAYKRYPAYIADMAAVIIPKVSRVAPAGGMVTSPNYYQFGAACAATENAFDIDEQLWKRLDKLESFVSARTALNLGNKACVQMEKIISVCLECGADGVEALDTAVAMKLAPHIAYALKGKLSADDPELAAVFGSCFGDDNIGHCLTVLNVFNG